jgi:hypothetical protein
MAMAFSVSVFTAAMAAQPTVAQASCLDALNDSISALNTLAGDGIAIEGVLDDIEEMYEPIEDQMELVEGYEAAYAVHDPDDSTTAMEDFWAFADAFDSEYSMYEIIKGSFDSLEGLLDDIETHDEVLDTAMDAIDTEC